MCGIFGVILKSNNLVSNTKLSNILKNLIKYSENRGKDSSGFYLYLPQKGKSWILKSQSVASKFFKSKDFKNVLALNYECGKEDSRDEANQQLIILGHSRLVTNGEALNHLNNQPVQSGKVTIIHNGIIVNVEELWTEQSHLNRKAEVDTEILAALLDNQMQNNNSKINSTRYAFEKIKGAASIAWAHNESESVVLATNTGDIYYYILPDEQGMVFASEKYILKKSLTQNKKSLIISDDSIINLQAGKGLLFSSHSEIKPIHFDFSLKNTNEENNELIEKNLSRTNENYEFFYDNKKTSRLEIISSHHDYSLLKYNEEAIKALKRCSCCILPETFPFISYDKDGVCNYCKNYKPRYSNMDHANAKTIFINSLQKYKSNNNSPDVLVPFSGGRDSSYGLHLICNEFNLNPITFTYDWGMVTDLARRNIARMCGELGVQNILVSADIQFKRNNIRNNIVAWLKKPDLGMVPLFMSGDKAFFKIVNQLKKQTGIDLNLWCANPLENTDFKSGFCGISPDFEKTRIDALSMSRKFKLIGYYLKQFISNPNYINTSLLDTTNAFLSYYLEPRRDFYFLFDKFIWNEDEVNHTLLSEYDWEISPDSSSTWRIGDGTAPFYNYIYNISYGFSEFDTFRSNQIREGMISREKALEMVLIENRPRQDSLRWYLETINLDFNSVIKKINQLDKLKLHH